MQTTEILAPAGNTECAYAALQSGADALYLGYSAFSARAGAENFNDDALSSLLKDAHILGAKVYVAMNTLVKESEREEFLRTLLKLWGMGVDAIILQDIFLGKYVHDNYPEIVLHVSTQAGVCSVAGARLAKDYGFSRVILARETPFREIEKIAKIIETEVFVQGALCTCFSGQCYFSSFVGGQSGNRGRCKQPCRKRYSYDRVGMTEQAYALSLSDLCVGEEIKKLATAGVCSFKIEGRMRRKEYVAAAVKYYRALLGGVEEKEKAQKLSDLKRAYNRGNYTRGLAFGQDKRFLSRAVQGHLGEKVGVVKVVGGKYFVESVFRPSKGDGFKILREGQEVGGAFYESTQGRGFILSSKLRLKNGDGVFVTTDTAAMARSLSGERKRLLRLSLVFAVGERAIVSGDGVEVVSEFTIEEAKTGALSEEEVKRCFEKVDALPLRVEFEKLEIKGRGFVPKSALNAFRREFYRQWTEKTARTKNIEPAFKSFPTPAFFGENSKTAVISDDFTGVKTEIAIYKPSSYFTALPESFLRGDFEKYVYCPPLMTDEELCRLFSTAAEYGLGVYADNYAAVYAAKASGVKLFAGTGFNLTNSLSIAELLKESCVVYYALSKELSVKESEGLTGEKAFSLTHGDIKLMDLCYCPFGKSCLSCDRRTAYTLTDEIGRAFPVRRYEVDGECRFEVFNCAKLVGRGVPLAGRLIEVTAEKEKAAANATTEEQQRKSYEKYTSGHAKNGVQ